MLTASALQNVNSQQQIQIVAQCLPSQAQTVNHKPLFEEILEIIQSRALQPPYITITHAVPEMRTMNEVPTSPPATPSASNTGDEYFGNQSVFTHAAVVPTYHNQNHNLTTSLPRPSNNIVAPSTINLSILERYIPPTSPREVHDFFSLGGRSYMVDRLSELSVNHGSMLLVYPTKAGARTFAKRYLGPIVEPFLRQFVLLNNLYSDAAAALGRMAATESMFDFDEMSTHVQTMCQVMSQRPASRGLRGRYEIVHAETAQVILERSIWTDWYVEQEQARLRNDLVEYHKSGGRMPSPRGQVEVTTGMLAREVVEGIRNSKAAAGQAGIEVGVFLIRRSAL